MFIAWSKKDNRFIFSGDKPEIIAAYLKASDLYCPHFRDVKVTWRKKGSDGRRAHFALYPNSVSEEVLDKLDFLHKGEGVNHSSLKYAVLEELYQEHNEGIENGSFILEEEYILGDQIGDIFYNSGGFKEVIEIQFSPITLNELQKRTEGWLSKGVDRVHWYLRDKIADSDMKNYLFDTQGICTSIKVERAFSTSELTYEI